MEKILPVSKKSKLFFIISLFLILFSQGVLAQTTGDFRSAVDNVNWSSLSSWERWNGSSWATPTSGEGYPGENTGTGNVTIRFGGSINLDVSPTNAISSLNVGDGTTSGSGISNNAATLSIGSNTLIITNDLVISSADSSRIGTLDGGSGTVQIGGNFSTAGGGVFVSGTGTIYLNGTSQQTIGGLNGAFYNFTLNNSAGVLLAADQTVNNQLTLSSGNLDISNKILTLGATAPAISGAFSNSTMIIADGGGEIRKNATDNSSASYTFPIGDNTGTAEYSPVTLSVTGSVYSSAYIGVSVKDVKHPDNASSTDYLTRYWNVLQSGITACQADVTGTYINTSSDVTGTLSSITSAQLNGTFNQSTNPWFKTGGSVLSGTTLAYTGATITVGQTSAFTGITAANPTVSITGGNVTTCYQVNVPLGTSVTGDGTILYSWSPSTFLSDSTIANPVVTAPTTTTTYTVTITDGNGITTTSAPSTVTVGGTTTYTSGTWDNGAPTDGTKTAVIAENYTSAGGGLGNINACSLEVFNGATVVISSGDTVTLSGALIADTGSLVTFNNIANLVQTGSTNDNVGNITVKRDSSALKRLDYTLWCSPVSGNQMLLDFSPLTENTSPNGIRFYQYKTDTNLYSSVTPSATTFAMAKGYLIRVPNNHPTSTPTVWTGSFVGVPNNGDYAYTLQDSGAGKRYNLIGNPYPSPIDATSFVSDSNNSGSITGTLYFWRKTNAATLIPTYSTWTTMGFTSNGDPEVSGFDGVIQTGQGFFVEGTGSGTTVNFDNSMRLNNHDNQFFKFSKSDQKNRIWLNASGTGGEFSQTLIGYVPGATNDVDPRIDGKYRNDGAIALTSLIGTTDYAIQGRAYPFDAADVVPLSFKATNAGTYTIAIDHVDGLFSNGQTVYLRDKLMGIEYDLTTGAYTFSSDAGTFTSRFEVVYETSLGVKKSEFNENQVVVYKTSPNTFVVNAGNVVMQSVKIYDLQGRLLQNIDNINGSQITVNSGLVNEVLLVKATSNQNETVTKKVMN